jgi:hypothetical protein
VSIDLKINWEIEVEWVCWFDLRCVWFDLNWDSNVWDLRDNSILMEWRRVCCHSMRDVSVLSSSTLLMESFQYWVCSNPTLQSWSNSSFSTKICWFLLFHSIWTLSNLSNVLILLECCWENHNNTNWECVIEWVIQFVLEVMWFHCLKVRDVEVMWIERFVMEGRLLVWGWPTLTPKLTLSVILKTKRIIIIM